MDPCPDSAPSLVTYLPAFAVLLAALVAGWIAYRVKIAEFRQRWINELRSDIADLLGNSLRYHRTRDRLYSNKASTSYEASVNQETPAEPDEEADQTLRKLEEKMDPIHNRNELRINPRENAHMHQDCAFLTALKNLHKSPPLEPDPDWPAKLEMAMDEARELLKREWETTKSLLPDGLKRSLDELEHRRPSAH